MSNFKKYPKIFRVGFEKTKGVIDNSTIVVRLEAGKNE